MAAAAHLDALMSLAVAAQDSAHMKRPKILDPATNAPCFVAKGLLHPAAIKTQDGAPFVPNDVALGADEQGAAVAPAIVLSGPNMGGKSTLLRQVCLTAVLAQIGAWVPAESVALVSSRICVANRRETAAECLPFPVIAKWTHADPLAA